MRFGNGMGSVIKLSGNRRKPYAVRVTAGWVDGKQKFKYVGYYETHPKALEALLLYNGGQIAVDTSKTLFSDVFDRWITRAEKSLTAANKRDYELVYRYCEKLHHRVFSAIKSDDLQAVLDECDKSKSFKKKMKSMFNQMYIYADEHDLARKNMAKFTTINSDKESREGVPFTKAEIEKLWSMQDNFDVAILLILIYSGMRINELLDIKLENVHLVDRYVVGGKKTKAGKDRIIPISDKTFHLVEKHLGTNGYMLESEGQKINYHAFYQRFRKLMAKLGMEHTIHDTRHTTISMLHSAEVPEVTIKKIVGHSNAGNITAMVYIHKTVEELREAINKI